MKRRHSPLKKKPTINDVITHLDSARDHTHTNTLAMLSSGVCELLGRCVILMFRESQYLFHEMEEFI